MTTPTKDPEKMGSVSASPSGALYGASTEARASDPVAYRVKDFADGWFFYDHQTQLAEAARAELDGFLVQPLYLQPILTAAAVGPSTPGETR